MFGGQVSTSDWVQTAKIVYHRDGYNALELAIKAGHQCVVEVIQHFILESTLMLNAHICFCILFIFL